MADGSIRTPGTGETIASDDVGDGGVANGQKVQRIKVGVGADGAYADALPPSTSGIAASATLPAGALVWDTALSAFVPARNAKSATDGSDGSGTVETHPKLFNGASFDRARGNLGPVSQLASAARTAQATGPTQTNYNHRGVMLALSIASAGTGNLTVVLQTPVTFQIVAFTAMANSGVILIYPGIVTDVSVAGNQRYNYALTRSWRAIVNPSDGSSWTYSLDAYPIL